MGHSYAIDWNGNGTSLAFAKHYKGIFVYDMASNSTSSYYNLTNISSYFFALDWSPNDKYIAFNLAR